jgi:acetyl-CoA C-acetyltransferase
MGQNQRGHGALTAAGAGAVGAIALGHPLAATGVRLTVTLARELQRSGLRYGISSACVGGGQGIALLIENPEAT